MSRITEKFDVILKNKSKALITYVTAGDPDLETTIQLVTAMEENGADLIELGVPFSDPLADGTTIQRASQRALKSGVTLSRILEAITVIRKTSSVPLILMSYYNPIFRFGIDAFVEESVRCGVDGVIIPDLPPEEAGTFLDVCRPGGLDQIFLLAPTSTPERMRFVAEKTRGFLYCVSLTGVTGARKDSSQDLESFISFIRSHTDKPLAVGFGISTPVQARQAARFADGVIVGSAFVDIVEKEPVAEMMIKRVSDLVRDLKSGITISE